MRSRETTAILRMTSFPVIIAILLVLFLLICSVWLSTVDLSRNQVPTSPRTVNPALSEGQPESPSRNALPQSTLPQSSAPSHAMAK